MDKKTQSEFIRQYYRENFPGCTPSGLSTLNEEYLRSIASMWYADASTVTRLAKQLAEGLFREEKIKDYRDFSSKLGMNIEMILRLDYDKMPWSYPTITKKGVEQADARGTILSGFIRETNKLKMPFLRQRRSLHFLRKVLGTWTRKKPAQYGEYTVHFIASPHPEAPIGIAITKGNKLIATVGGVIHFGKKNPVIRITNIQGTSLHLSKETREERNKIREHAKEYHKLNKTLGENWETFFVKEATKISNSIGIKLIGERPRRYGMGFNVPLGKHLKNLRKYKVAYESAGLTQRGKLWEQKPAKRRTPLKIWRG